MIVYRTKLKEVLYMQKRDIIKYIVIVVIVIAIIVLFKNLVTVDDNEQFKSNGKQKLYSVTVSLQDEDTKENKKWGC